MLLEQIKQASLEARRAKDSERAALLVTLYAEAARVGKDAGNRETTDDEVVKVIRKFLKGVDESLAVITIEGARQRAQLEKSVLESFLPRKVEGAELEAVIAGIVGTLADRTPRQMGVVMKALKDQLAGAYDGNEASALVKKLLA